MNVLIVLFFKFCYNYSILVNEEVCSNGRLLCGRDHSNDCIRGHQFRARLIIDILIIETLHSLDINTL